MAAKRTPSQGEKLRREAEKRLNLERKALLVTLPEGKVKDLLHELHVHQIELEMQNEELRRAGLEIEQSRQRYADLYDFAPISYFSFDENGLIIDVNLTGARMLGLERLLLLKKPFVTFVAGDYRDSFHRHLRKACKSGDKQTCELEINGRDGSGCFVLAESVAAADEEGKLRCRTSLSDISQRREAEENLEVYRAELENTVQERTRDLLAANERLLELNRLKVMFIASMSHELRTPLNAILGFTGVMLQGMTGELSEEQERQLTMVSESGQHLLSLINEILDVGRIEMGEAEVAATRFNLVDTLIEVMNFFALTALEKNISLDSSLPRSMAITGDPKKIKQVVSNLVSNAVKVTAKGTVAVAAGRKGRKVLISVTDTGPGIKEEYREKIFTPFCSLSPEQQNPTDGTGLGLYLSRKIALLLRGDLTYRSTPGRGSTFMLTLPVK